MLELCNGIAYGTSLWPWLRKPRTLLVFHVHQDHYVTELGLLGRVAAVVAERIPLQHLYPGVPVLTISQVSARGARGARRRARPHPRRLPRPGPGVLEPGEKSESPTLVYLGRLKQYKRIDRVLDAVAALPEGTLDIVGDGDQREALEQEVVDRGLADRVHLPRPRQRGGEAATSWPARGWR